MLIIIIIRIFPEKAPAVAAAVPAAVALLPFHVSAVSQQIHPGRRRRG